jgi:hypothetical protein
MIYLPGLNGPFFLDDNPQLTPLFSLGGEHPDIHVWDYISSRSGHLGRPVSMGTFIANAVLHGSDIWYWKLWNLIIHIVTGLVMYFLTLRLCRVCSSRNNASYVALLVTACWLLHPLQVSTVLYTVQRMAQLSTFFILCGLLLYVIGRQALLQRNQKGWLYIAAVFFLLFPLAVFSKENGILFPLLVFILEWFVFRFEIEADQKKYLVGLFVLFLWIPFLIGSILLIVGWEQWVLNGYLSRDFTLGERLLTQFRVMLLYIGQIVYPVPSGFGFFHDDIVLSKSLIDPIETILSLMFLSALLILAWFYRNRFPLFVFGVLLFFASHLLESTIFSLELMFEHRNYLASYGIILSLAIVIHAVFASSKTFVTKYFPISLVVFLSLLLVFRVQAWSSENSMYLYMQKQRPDSKRLTVIVANMYAENGFYNRASKLLSRFDDAGFKINALYIKCRQGGKLDGDDFSSISVASNELIDLYASEAIINLANLGLDNLCHFNSLDFIGLIDKTLDARASSNLARQKLLMYKAHYLHREKQYLSAVKQLDNAFNEYDINPVPLFLASEWLLDIGDLDSARKYYVNAVMVSESSGKNYSELINQVGSRFPGKVE